MSLPSDLAVAVITSRRHRRRAAARSRGTISPSPITTMPETEISTMKCIRQQPTTAKNDDRG